MNILIYISILIQSLLFFISIRTLLYWGHPAIMFYFWIICIWIYVFLLLHIYIFVFCLYWNIGCMHRSSGDIRPLWTVRYGQQRMNSPYPVISLQTQNDYYYKYISMLRQIYLNIWQIHHPTSIVKNGFSR